MKKELRIPITELGNSKEILTSGMSQIEDRISRPGDEVEDLVK